MINTTAFCAICQKDTPHTVDFEDTEQITDGKVIAKHRVAIKFTCENTTDEQEHAIRISPNAKKGEIVQILGDHKKSFKDKDISVKVEEDDETKLSKLFN